MDSHSHTELQNFLNQMDSGTGNVLIRWLLFTFFAFITGALFIFTNFQGLKSAETMEYAQLARNFAQTGALRTQCLRPLTIGLLEKQAAAADAPLAPETAAAWTANHPDLLHPPLYPLALGGLFKLAGMPIIGSEIQTHVYRWDYTIVIFNAFFLGLCTLLIGVIAQRMFDLRVASLAMASWLLMAAVWQEALTGANLAQTVFLSLVAAYFAIRSTESPSPAQFYLFACLSAAATAAAFLTGYAAAVIALPLFLFIGTSPRPGAWRAASLYLFCCILPVIPWLIRNMMLSGHLFGLAPQLALADTAYLYPADALERTLSPSLKSFTTSMRAIQIKMIDNIRTYAPLGFGLGNSTLFGGFFCAMFFHRFYRNTSHRFRWCLLPAIPIAILTAAAFSPLDDPTAVQRAMLLFLPFILLYAWAFMLILLDRITFETPFPAYLAITAALLIGALPYITRVLPPRSGRAYPPYYHNHIAWTASLIAPEEYMISDMPWASAWYGGKTAILLPRTLNDFYTIHNTYAPISLAYFTPITRNKAWIRDLVNTDTPDHVWYRIFTEKVVPRDFPLPEARTFFGEDEMILIDRPRWLAP